MLLKSTSLGAGVLKSGKQSVFKEALRKEYTDREGYTIVTPGCGVAGIKKGSQA